MTKNPRGPGELERTLNLQRVFPNLGNGFSNGLNYREIAQKIITNSDKAHGFDNYSINTVIKYIKWALHGFEYNGDYFDGLRENDIDSQINQRRRKTALLNSGFLKEYTQWSRRELVFVKQLYEKGIPPKEIWKRYLEQGDDFELRTYNSIESIIVSMKKKGEISQTQRVFWDGDIGFCAMYLLVRYRGEKNSSKEICNSLNDSFYEGEQRITPQKLHNFRKRNSLELEEILKENPTINL